MGLWWVDISRHLLQRLDLEGGSASWQLDETPGSLAVIGGGSLLVAVASGLARFEPERGSVEPLCGIEQDSPDTRLNDGKTDPAGRFWVGSMDRRERRRIGSLYRYDGTLSRLFDGVGIPNSLAWSPDGRTVYFAETLDRSIFVFDFDPDSGEIGNRRLFATVPPPGYPDGSCTDEEGFLWNAEYGGWRLVRYAPDGRVDRIVELPVANPTCPAFGGDGLDTLFVTTSGRGTGEEGSRRQPPAGALLAVDAGVRGMAAVPFVHRGSR